MSASSNTFIKIKPEFTPLSLLRALWKHKSLAFLITCVVSAAGVAVVWQLPPLYVSDALILVDPQKIPERFVSSTVNMDAQDRLAIISQEILSSTRLQAIIETFNLYPEERKTHVLEEVIGMMRRDISIRLEKGVGGSSPGAFRVTYQGREPVVLAKVVNCITDLYIQENQRARETRAQGTSDFIHTELREAKQKLDELEAAVSQYKLEHNGQLPQQENSIIAMLTKSQTELQVNQDASNRARQDKMLLETALAAAEAAEVSLGTQSARRPAAAVAESVDDPSPEPAPTAVPSKYQHDYDTLQEQLASVLVRYSEDHPDVKRLRQAIAVVKRMQREERESQQLAAAAPAKPKPGAATRRTAPAPAPPPDPLFMERTRAQERITTLKAQVAAAGRELEARKADRERILQSLAGYERRLEQLPVREQEMARLTRDFEVSRGYYNSLLNKKTEAEMATDLERRQKAETFRILDIARPPEKPFKPKRGLLSLVGLAMGLALGVVVAIGLELKTGTVLGEWELPAGTFILGRVPHISPAFTTLANSGGGVSEKKRLIPGRFAMLASGALFFFGTIVMAAYLIHHRF